VKGQDGDPTELSLRQIVCDFSKGLYWADEKKPKYLTYDFGIGPHPEHQQIKLVFEELRSRLPTQYYSSVNQGPALRYPNGKRATADFSVSNRIVEAKLFRPIRNNGDPEPTMVGNILSPYPKDQSAVTDCQKLASSGFPQRKARRAVSKPGRAPSAGVREGDALKTIGEGEHAMVKRRAVVVFSMVVVALIAAGCVASSAPEPASHTIKTGGLYRAKTDAPICETHDELVTAAYEYDGGHTPDVSGCAALAKGEEVKVLVPRAIDDLNAVQVDTQGHIGWTKSYYLDASPLKSN
jgi:hypothetical protein